MEYRSGVSWRTYRWAETFVTRVLEGCSYVGVIGEYILDDTWDTDVSILMIYETSWSMRLME